jgi:excisionase family DNA binding protein
MPYYDPEVPWFTVREAADYAHVSRYTIRRAIYDGELRAGLAGNLIRLRPEQVDEWLERRGKSLVSALTRDRLIARSDPQSSSTVFGVDRPGEGPLA